MTNSIGIKIQNLRKQANMSQFQLGKVLGIAASTLGMYETGKREPSLKVLNKIANYFNVSTDYLLGRSEPSQENKHVTETVEQALSHVMSFDGRPVTPHDRAVLQQIAEAYLKGRDQDEGEA